MIEQLLQIDLLKLQLAHEKTQRALLAAHLAQITAQREQEKAAALQQALQLATDDVTARYSLAPEDQVNMETGNITRVKAAPEPDLPSASPLGEPAKESSPA